MDKKDLIAPAAALTIATANTMGASAAYDSSLNKPATWGNTCIKTEMSGDVKTYSVTDGGVSKVIVKGGTDNAVYTKAPFTDLKAPVNPKNGQNYGISHVIVCYDGSAQQVIPVATTKPETTENKKEVKSEDKKTDHKKEVKSAKTEKETKKTNGHASSVATVKPANGQGAAKAKVAGVSVEKIASTGNDAAKGALIVLGAGGATYAVTRAMRRR